VALASSCTKDSEKSQGEPSNPDTQQVPVKVSPPQQVPSFASSWAVDDFLELTGFDSPDKVRQIYFTIL